MGGPVALGPLLGAWAAGFEFCRDAPVLSGKHRPRRTAVRHISDPEVYLTAGLKARDSGKHYYRVNFGGRRVLYAHVLLVVAGKERPDGKAVPHHEKYRRERYRGRDVWVGDDEGQLSWETRAAHAGVHELSRKGCAAKAAAAKRRGRRGRKPKATADS